MAEKKYSPADQQKMMQDFMADANARGCDFQGAAMVGHPDGTAAAIKDLKKDMSYVKDQSQAQTEVNVEKAKHINDPKEPRE